MDQTWKQRIAEAARKQREQELWEMEHPEEAERMKAEREQLRLQRTAEERADSERIQLEGTGQHLRRCGFKDLEISVVTKGVEDRPAVKHAHEFWDGDKTFLLMCGKTGKGKTIAAASLALNCKFRFRHPNFGDTWMWPSNVSMRPHYECVTDMARESHFGEEEIRRGERLANYRLLVLDELGAELMTDSWRSRLENLIDDRMRSQRKTILVSNLNFAEFKSRYGDRIARRVREFGECHAYGDEPALQIVRDAK